MAQIKIDISHNPFDNRQVILTISDNFRYALKEIYGLTLEDLVFNSINKELSYLYEQHLRGEEEALRNTPEPTHSEERTIHKNTDPT